ncbi:hypothetical protein IU479_06315 [Nocardia abscessus]|nr:hypothetical protein [Nocardia abscessus]
MIDAECAGCVGHAIERAEHGPSDQAVARRTARLPAPDANRRRFHDDGDGITVCHSRTADPAAVTAAADVVVASAGRIGPISSVYEAGSDR